MFLHVHCQTFLSCFARLTRDCNQFRKTFLVINYVASCYDSCITDKCGRTVGESFEEIAEIPSIFPASIIKLFNEFWDSIKHSLLCLLWYFLVQCSIIASQLIDFELCPALQLQANFQNTRIFPSLKHVPKLIPIQKSGAKWMVVHSQTESKNDWTSSIWVWKQRLQSLGCVTTTFPHYIP